MAESKRGGAQKPKKPFIVLFVGEIGVGKSALINALCPPHCKQRPVSGGGAGGVTKDFYVYPIDIGPEFDQAIAIDCMGVGDNDSKLPKLISGIESCLSARLQDFGCENGNGVNAVVICTPCKPRVTLGAQVAAAILNMGIIEHNQDGLNSMVICGTMADEVKERKIKLFRDQTGPHFEKFLGGTPKHIVVTGIEKEEDENGENRVDELLHAFRSIGNEYHLTYKKVAESRVVQILGNSTGLEIKSESEFVRDLQRERQSMTEKINRLEMELGRMRMGHPDHPNMTPEMIYYGAIGYGVANVLSTIATGLLAPGRIMYEGIESAVSAVGSFFNGEEK